MKSAFRPWFLGLCAVLACRSVPVSTAPGRAGEVPLAAPAEHAWVHTPPPGPLPTERIPPPRFSGVTLPNGLRVIVIEHHRRPVTVVSLVLPRGALADPPSDAGLTEMAVALASDYYERDKAGLPIDEEKSFRRQVAELGGAAGFEVGSDYSLLRISGYAQDTGAYLKMLAEAVIHPRHGKGSFSGRRNAALDAFEDLESSDPEAFQQVVADGAFGEGHPYARSIAGTTASLTPLGLEDVIAHQERVLVPDGATLVIVGDVDSTLVLAAARKAFEKWAGQRAALPRVPPPALPADTRTVGYLERRSASTLVVCATRPLADVHASDAALDVLAAMLGEGTASRLGTVLRESNGLTYGASAQIVHRRHARALVACSALKGKEAPLGVELFRKVLERAQTAEPTPAELERAKAVRLSELETAYETALDASHTWVEAVAIGTGAPRLEQERAAIEKVTAAEVQKLARSVLSLKTVRWVVSGDKLVASRAIEATGVGRLHKISPGR